MARSRIGLDIGSTAVRAAELTGGDTPSVIRAAQLPLPEGAVENGEVRDPELVATALRELWQRGDFKSHKVWMGVGNQRLVVREIALPAMPQKELRESLGFQVQEFIPMPVDQAVLDFDPIEEFDRDGRTMLRMLLVAAQREMVDLFVLAATQAKLEPIGLDLLPFATVRSVGTTGVGMDLEEVGEEAIVDVGAHVTSIVVHAGGTTRFVRILPSGGRDLTIAIARGMGVEADVAERLKRGEEIDVTEERADEDGEPAAPPRPDEAHRIALERAAGFIDEVRSSLEFYTAQAEGQNINRVVITGGGSKLNGLFDLARQRIPIEVSRGEVFKRAESKLTLSPEALTEAESVLSAAVGLAIPGHRA